MTWLQAQFGQDHLGQGWLGYFCVFALGVLYGALAPLLALIGTRCGLTGKRSFRAIWYGMKR
jgi:hypothetical protein